LEFVKYTCKILSLDKNIHNQINKLQRELFALINVREFSDEAQFVDPSLSFIVPQIICLKCHHSKDLDLCRDPCSNLKDETDRPIGWYCSQCGAYYDTKYIEFFLIEKLHSKLISHVTQDILCNKCNEVRGSYLQKYCECTGTYINLIKQNEIKSIVKAFMNFLKHIKMEKLQNEIEWLVHFTPALRDNENIK